MKARLPDRLARSGFLSNFFRHNRPLPVPMKHFTTFDVLTLSVIFLGSACFLISSFRPPRSPQERKQQRVEALTGLLGLLSGGLDLCWHLGLLRYSSVVYFSRHLLRGIVVALLVVMIFPKTTKFLLALSVALLIAFNLFAIGHHNPMLRGSKHASSIANWFLAGLSLTCAIFVWQQGQTKSANKTRDGAAASREAAGTGKETYLSLTSDCTH